MRFSFSFGALWPFLDTSHVEDTLFVVRPFAPITYLHDCIAQQHLQHLYKQRQQHFCRKLIFLEEPQRVGVCKSETAGYF